jgi:medium-chain acyl-[acyl-carrier-protein] hydrolase
MMVEMLKEKEYFVHYFNTNNKLKLSIVALMQFFEDIALLQSEEREVGLNYYKKNNIAWVLNQFEIRIKEHPKYKDKIIVRTFPTSYLRFYAHRAFQIFNENDDIVISADSIWIFVDTITKRPKTVTDDMYNAYCITPGKNELKKLEEVKRLSEVNYEEEFTVRWSDIDINDHVNNVKYVVWALETMPMDVLNEKDVELVRIAFKKEIKYGAHVKSKVQIITEQEKTISLHSITGEDDKEACLIEIHWK